ncbi:hypothetical protein Scep_005461 [Stephania cephalantha]|uniref:Protein YIP n=1 Tax=Stephania cephalantha TaxID=152367 RepID=A0AAP0PWE6_9MAGN
MDESYTSLPTSHLLGSVPGVFSVSSYTQFFNVDTDIVVERIRSSFYPIRGDFFRKIDSNPDLYGLIWISTSLVFVISALGNCATYLMQKKSDGSIPWSFNVSYVNLATCAIYGYALVVPAAFYFLLRYLGSSPSIFLLVIPVEFVRWIIILLAGLASASFVALNVKTYTEGSDLMVVVVASFVLQIALALFIKLWFFP